MLQNQNGVANDLKARVLFQSARDRMPKPRRRMEMSNATKRAMIEKPESAVLPTAFETMSRLEQDMERMFHEFWRRPFPFLSLWDQERSWPGKMVSLQMPAVDVYEESDEVVVKAELPGLSKEDIDVTLTDSTLTLKGERKKEEEVKEKNFYRSERSRGSFVRSIELPSEVKTDQTKASFKNGILEIRLPKTEEAKKKFTKVKID
jgi:HSP20 family protein